MPHAYLLSPDRLQPQDFFRHHTGKLGYPNKTRAKLAAARTRKRPGYRPPTAGAWLDVYLCNVCGQWHIGHTR